MVAITDDQIEKLADEYLLKVGYVDNPQLIKHDFIEGAKAILLYIKQNNLYSR